MLDRNRCIKLSIFINACIHKYGDIFRDMYMHYLYFFSILFHDFLAVIYLFVFIYSLFIDVNSNVAQHLSKNSYILFNYLQL